MEMELKMEGVTQENFASMGPPVKKALSDVTSTDVSSISLRWKGLLVRRHLEANESDATQADSIIAEFVVESNADIGGLTTTISSNFNASIILMNIV